MIKFLRTIANLLGAILVLGAVAGAGTALYLGGKNNGWFDEYIKPNTEQSTTDDGLQNELEGMVMPTESSGKQMRVTARALAASAFSDYGVSAQAENAYTLTAEVFPEYASDKSVNWVIAWADGDSQWASGKTVMDYVTVTPTADGALTAVLACVRDFGEPIILTVSSRSNPDICGVTVINYYQCVKSLNYVFKLDGNGIDVSADSNGVYKVDFTGEEKNYTVELTPVYSAYTLADEYTTTVSGQLSSAFGYVGTSNLNVLSITANISGGEPKMSSNLINWHSAILQGVLSDVTPTK